VLLTVTVQLANELKGEGFTFIAMHPGEDPVLLQHASQALRAYMVNPNAPVLAVASLVNLNPSITPTHAPYLHDHMWCCEKARK
jgi:hypothetical protein